MRSSAVPLYQLQISELIVSPEPAVISTVLGSCVSICLYSERAQVGGMIHYALPEAPPDVKFEESFRYGSIAIPALIEEVCRISGEAPGRLCAKLTGGAAEMGESSAFPVGAVNIAIAREILNKYCVQIIGEAVGGAVGRKVLFHTASGRLQVANVKHSGMLVSREIASGNLVLASNLKQPAGDTDLDMRTLLCIGASTGGTEALKTVMCGLPEKIPPTLIVQHIPPGFSGAFANRLNNLCQFDVKEASDGDDLRPGRVLIAPGGRQMRLERHSAGFRVRVNDDPPMNRHKPSVDYLFHSVAEVVGKKVVGVLLTGMGADGAQGLLAFKRNGCRTIAQDEDSSVVYGMPKVAYELGAVDRVVPLNGIPREIVRALKR